MKSTFTRFRIEASYFSKKDQEYLGGEQVIVTKLPEVSIDAVLEYIKTHDNPSDYDTNITVGLGFSAPLKADLKHNENVKVNFMPEHSIHFDLLETEDHKHDQAARGALAAFLGI